MQDTDFLLKRIQLLMLSRQEKDDWVDSKHTWFKLLYPLCTIDKGNHGAQVENVATQCAVHQTFPK